MFKNFQNYFWSSQRSIISIMKKNFKIFQSERFQICRHSSSKILCDVVLEALQATHLLQSSQAILHHVPFFVLSSSWKNCLQNMVVFVNQTSSQIMDSTVSKSLFRISIVVFLCINIKVANETVWWIRAFPRFYASFRGSQGHILFHRKSSLERNHCFFDWNILRRPVIRFYGIYDWIEKRRTLNNFSWFSCPRGSSVLLSLKCRYCAFFAKRFLGKIFCTAGPPSGRFFDHYE